MSIRVQAIAVCVLVWFLAGCRTDTPTPLPAATPLRTPTAPPTPTPLAVSTPVPIATWVAQDIPSDLVITVEQSGSFGNEFDTNVRIGADGSATYIRDPAAADDGLRKLSPDALRQIVLAFAEHGFFYLEDAGQGCLFDIRDPPSATTRPGYITDMGKYSVSIRINGLYKSLTVENCIWTDKSGDQDKNPNATHIEFFDLASDIMKAVYNAPTGASTGQR